MDGVRDVDSSVTAETNAQVDTAIDLRDRLVLDLVRHAHCRVLAVAEPVSAGAYPNATEALAAFRAAICWSTQTDPEDLLSGGFHAANETVWRANQAAGTDPRRRKLVGITAAVITSEAIVIGIVPPGRVMTADGPYVRTFEGGRDAQPLGAREEATPQVSHVEATSQTRLALGSVLLDDLIECAPSDPAIVETGSLGPRATSLVGPGSIAILATVEELVAPQLAISPIASSAQEAAPVIENAIQRTRNYFRGNPAAKRTVTDEVSPRPIGGRIRPIAAPGSRAVSVYRSGGRPVLSPTLRCRLPRGLRLPVSGRVVACLAALLLLLSGAGFGYDVRQTRAARQDRYFAIAKTHIEAGQAARSSTEADRHFAVAQGSLDDAARTGAAQSMIVSWRTQLLTARDTAHGVYRLGQSRRLGTLPTEIDGARARLLRVGDELFVVADGIYRLEATQRTLVAVLQPGTDIGGQTANAVLDAVADGGDIVASDGSTLFRRSATGGWSAIPLGGGWWSLKACGTYDGNFYLLEEDSGEILRFSAGQLTQEPEPWVMDESVDELRGARDMVVDGSIHVLRDDGTIQTFHRGLANHTTAVTTGGSGETAVALYGAPDTVYLYVAERSAGHGLIVRYERTTGDITRYLMPAPGQVNYDPAADQAMRGITDLVVDENQRVAFFVGGNSVWSTTLPPD